THQLYKPELWTQSLEELVTLGVTEVIECCPNKVFSGLIKRIDKSIDINDTHSIERLENI
ncbi:[acyl-carrier-protein] S-malonyltransferase, partial [Francisella tularensis subsp. holarctica]|nr:[acyl-carrier-protein] S-malonyltransferase [Francisella tularensis subsp. holarctica]